MHQRLIGISLFVVLHVVLIVGAVPISSVFPAVMGTIAISCMAFSLLLAARFSWVDYVLGGPDKSYILHRWLGYGAVLGHSGTLGFG